MKKMSARVSRTSGGVTADSTEPGRCGDDAGTTRDRRGSDEAAAAARRGSSVMYEDGFHLQANVTPLTANKEMHTLRYCSSYCSFRMLGLYCYRYINTLFTRAQSFALFN